MSVLETFAYGVAIGLPLLIGSAAGAVFPAHARAVAVATAFGGGILLAALAFDVVPEAERHSNPALTAAGLVAGALLFLAIDWWLTRDERRRDMRRRLHGGRVPGEKRGRGEESARGLSLALGIFLDGVPETAALGLMIAEGDVGVALFVGIVVSNLVESFGSSAPIVEGGRSRTFATMLFGGIAAALVLALIVGATLLHGVHESVIAFAEAVAGGAIFATVSITIMPHAFAEVSRWSAVAAVLGFVVGYALA